eukprot:Skav221799  [mRNA]  locus=scaffold4067:228872:236434:- [translate_table: standard]
MGHGEVRSIEVIPFDDHMPRGRMQAVDRDQDTDLIFGGRYFKRVALDTVTELLPDQNPLDTFVKEGAISKDINDMQFQIADMDGDGNLEMVMGSTPGRWGHGIRFFRRAKGGAFVEQTEHAFQDIWGAEAAHMADWNSDGLPDMLVHGMPFGFGSSALAFYERIQDGDLAEDHHTPYGDIKIGDCNHIHVVDWNNDGFLDVLKYCNSQLQLHESHVQNLVEVFGEFENVTVLENDTCSLAVADWDGDGDIDLLIASQSGKIHYHEMIDKHLQEEKTDHPFSSINLILRTSLFGVAEIPQPLVVDWDSDDDLDLILGPPDYRYFEQRNGSLLEWPQKQNPFRHINRWNVIFQLQLDPSDDIEDFMWRFLDCDGDGDLDLVEVVRTKYSSRHKGLYFYACEHTPNHALHCDINFLCLGTNLSNFHSNTGPLKKHGELYAWGLGATENGQLKILTVHKNKIWAWSAGVCLPEDPCHENGICKRGQDSCSCLGGHELADCSGCEPNFYSVEMGLGKAHSCKACPGESGKVCYGRGVCFDDAVAKNSSQTATAVQMAKGNGSCVCFDAHFFGMDGLGRSSCSDGVCPAGMEEIDGVCSPCQAGTYSDAGGICKKCDPGTKSLEASGNCLKCAPGTISQSGSSVCEACPAGKKELNRQWCNDCPTGSISFAGNDSCAECRAGTIATEPGSVVCNPCPPGTYAEEGSDKCIECASGTISGTGSGNCSKCDAGHFAKEKVACEACPGGTFAIPGSSSCRPCPAGHVSSPTSASCRNCASFLIRTTPDIAKQTCQASGIDVVLAGICWVTATAFCFSSLIGFCGHLPIADISSTQGQKVVVTTSIAHMFLKSKTPREVSFHNTGVPHLERGIWLVRALDAYQLTLHVAKLSGGQWRERVTLHVDDGRDPLDTSMGTFKLKFPRAFLVTGFLRCPTIAWSLLFLAATLAIMSQLTLSLDLLLGALGFLFGFSAFAFRRRLEQFFDTFIKERCMYYVCSNIIMPLTEPSQLSWAELVGSTPMEWFVSHFWGMAARHLGEAVRKHAQSTSLEWLGTAYWICTFSNSQWHVKAELGNGQWQESWVGNGPSKVSADAKPSGHYKESGLLLCTSTGVLQEGQAGTDVAVAVARTAANLDTRSAQATSEGDRQMIHAPWAHEALIEAMPGGFSAMNTFVRETICHALQASNIHYEKTFRGLMGELTARIDRDQEIARAEDTELPTLLTSPKEGRKLPKVQSLTTKPSAAMKGLAYGVSNEE